MFRAQLLGSILLLLGCALLTAQDAEKFTSGPKVGAFMPAAFECFNINGPAKGRPHCLICEFALNPSVLVFAKEPAEGKDGPLNELMKQLEELAEEFQDRQFSAGVIFLSPDARDATNNAGEEKSAEIIKEAVQREELHKRLATRAERLKHVIVACYPPEGPKEYKLNPKAEYTILFYDRLKVVANYAYPPDGLQAKEVEVIAKRVRDALPIKKKPAE